MAISRPDVAYAHSMLARHNQGGGERHMTQLLKVFAYLGRTSHYKIVYGKQGFANLCNIIKNNSDFKTEILDPLTMICMTDSSHGGERPMAGDVEFMAAAPVAWRACRAAITPLSVAQGEYMIASKATVEILSFRSIQAFLEISVNAPTIIFSDSLAAIQLADGNSSSARMKHIATRIAFLREQITAKYIMMYHIRTTGQIADIFTKVLAAPVFHLLRQHLLD